MSLDALAHDLGAFELGLRFPAGNRFLEGRTRLLGHGMAEGRRTLRMAMPTELLDDELRRGHRVTRTGRVEVRLQTSHHPPRVGRLINISTGGLRVAATGIDLEAELALGDRVALAVPLDPHLRLEAEGLVRWVAGPNSGLEFDPALAHGPLNDLSRWVFQRREEERLEVRPGVRTPADLPLKPVRNLLLVSAGTGLEESLGDLLGELGPLVRVNPSLPELQAALAAAPAVVLLHADGCGLEAPGLRALAAVAAGRCPVLLLGTDLEPAQLFRLASDLDLQHSFGYRPSLGLFLGRAVAALVAPDGPERRP
jgi:hypothetical protein